MMMMMLLPLGTVVEDHCGVSAKLDRSYCDDDGLWYADTGIVLELVVISDSTMIRMGWMTC